MVATPLPPDEKPRRWIPLGTDLARQAPLGGARRTAEPVRG